MIKQFRLALVHSLNVKKSSISNNSVKYKYDVKNSSISIIFSISTLFNSI